MGENLVLWTNQLPPGSPPHRLHGAFAGTQEKNIPYAFKAYALVEAAKQYDTLLWADACILPVQPLESLWERIERDGYWISRQGYNNYEWTADSAYPDLFPSVTLDNARELQRRIPHVVATSFGLSMKHPQGRAFLSEYYRLASTTRAFCGPSLQCQCTRRCCGLPHGALWTARRVGASPRSDGGQRDRVASRVRVDQSAGGLRVSRRRGRKDDTGGRWSLLTVREEEPTP